MSVYQIKLTKEELYPIYISIVLVIVGYVLSIYTNAEIFPRFGALIVCVGVYFGVKALPAKIDHAAPIFKSRMDELREEVNKFPECKEKELLKAKITEDEYKQNRTLFSLKNRLFKIEGGIIIIGTLIWAFGDCFVYNHFLTQQCF